MSDWQYQPAKDHTHTPGAQAKASTREPGLVSTLAVALATTASRTFMRTWHRYSVVGAEHLPVATPFVLIANHTSHMDHACLRNALPLALRVRTMPLAAGDVFFTSPIRSILASRLLNALPMWRRQVGPRALAELRERLSVGDVGYILFPEGTRVRDGQLTRFKAGIGMLTAGLNVPVIPAWIDGPHRAFPPGSIFPRPRKVTTIFGPSMTFADVANDKEGWQLVAARLQSAVETLRDAQGVPKP